MTALRWSITARLTVLYALSALGMLLLAAVFLHWSLVANLHREDGQFLADKISLLRTILGQNGPGTDSLQEEVEWETAALHFAKYYARILDANGRILIETPGMGAILPASVFPATLAPPRYQSALASKSFHGGQKFILLAASADPALPHSRQIQVALDISPQETFLQNYRRSLAWAILFGVLFSAVTGAWVARHGMRPIAELTRSTDRISASQLHERIASDSWPPELESLARGFDRMLDRLQDSFGRLSRFSGDLAHELRTPINNLRGEAGVALSQSRSPEEYRRIIESSLEEYARLSRLIDNLLFLARSDSPTASISRQPCNATLAVQSLFDFYEALAEDRGVSLRCSGHVEVSADPLLLRQALSNLVSNALNHTLRGGKVEVILKGQPDGSSRIQVSDTGCGIPEIHLPHIFDRLYQADPSRSRSSGGAGLGLAIVKTIMTLHQGEVSVESKVGLGSSFVLHFPAVASRTNNSLS